MEGIQAGMTTRHLEPDQWLTIQDGRWCKKYTSSTFLALI
jgi:hypothetical protein